MPKTLKPLQAAEFQGLVEGRRVQIGTHRWMQELGIATDRLQTQWDQLESLGRTVVWLAVDGQVEALMAIADAVKPSSAAAIATLQRMGLEVVMLTGDNRRTAEAIAREVGITRLFAEVRPDQKSAQIESLQREGKIVAMVGDGINDAPRPGPGRCGHGDWYKGRMWRSPPATSP